MKLLRPRRRRKCWSPECDKRAIVRDWMGWYWCLRHWRMGWYWCLRHWRIMARDHRSAR